MGGADKTRGWCSLRMGYDFQVRIQRFHESRSINSSIYENSIFWGENKHMADLHEKYVVVQTDSDLVCIYRDYIIK